MASNIYNQSDYQDILKRINALDKQNQRKWGTMYINQMLGHCSLQLKLGLGIVEQKELEGSSIMRTWFGRKSFFYIMPWSKGLPTPSKMNVVANDIAFVEFEEGKNQLLILLSQVQQNPNLKLHPFFGSMSQKDWGRLIWKHLDYHLKQFGG